MKAEVKVVVPRLWWADAPGKRVLYAGNHPDPVAWGEQTNGDWLFHVALPGEQMKPRLHGSRSACEAFTASLVEAWFKAVFA